MTSALTQVGRRAPQFTNSVTQNDKARKDQACQ
jgi:hypothetical protein